MHWSWKRFWIIFAIVSIIWIAIMVMAKRQEAFEAPYKAQRQEAAAAYQQHRINAYQYQNWMRKISADEEAAALLRRK